MKGVKKATMYATIFAITCIVIWVVLMLLSLIYIIVK